MVSDISLLFYLISFYEKQSIFHKDDTFSILISSLGFPSDSDGKESACSAGDSGSIIGSGKSPGKGNGDPLQYSFLENSMHRGIWRATIYGVTNSWTQQS